MKHKYLIPLTIVYVFIAVYMVHFSHQDEYILHENNINFRFPPPAPYYQFPIHGDEWNHLSIINYAIEHHHFPSNNPNIENSPKRTNLQIGFHSFTAIFFIATGLNPLTTYQFLPALNAMLIALVILFLIYSITNSIIPGIFAVIFLVTTTVNTNILGIWFFVPFTFSFSLLLICLFCYFNKDKKIQLLSYIIFAVLLITYPFASILLVGIFGLHAIHIRKISKSLLYVGTLSVIGLLFFFRTNLKRIFSELVFTKGYTGQFDHIYNPLEIYSIIGIVFAIIGIWLLLDKKNQTYLIHAVVLCSIPVIMFSTMNIAIGIPYQRALVYLAWLLSLFSGIGLYYFIKTLKETFPQRIALAILIPILIGGFIFLHHDMYSIKDERFKIVHMVPHNMGETFEFLKQYPQQTIMTDMSGSFAIYPATEHTVIGVPLSNLGGGNIDSVHQFFTQDCNIKKDIMIENNIQLVVSSKIIDCEQFYNVFSDARRVYEFRMN